MHSRFYDTDLTNAAWAWIAPVLPAARPGGRPRLRVVVAETSNVETTQAEHSHLFLGPTQQASRQCLPERIASRLICPERFAVTRG